MSLIASPVPGTFTAPQLVTLADSGSDAVFYTVDGSTPQYQGYARDWNDGLLGNQTNVSSNGTATFTNPGTRLRQTLTAAATSASSFLDSAPVPGFTSSESRISVRVRFNSSSCYNDTQACIIYRCAGKFTANDTYGYNVFVTPSGGITFGRGTNAAVGGFTQIAAASIPSGLAYDTWHTLTVTVRSQTHTVSVNGVVYGVWQDNTYSTPGYVGVRTYSGSAPVPAVDYDDFKLEFSAGTRYTAPVPVVPGTTATTVKALSVTGTTPSAVSNFTYTIGLLRAQQPTWSVTNRAVTLSDATPSASIYYTTDGTDPYYALPTGKFTDPRDGKVYSTVRMPDGKWWLSQNLAYSVSGVSYPNNDSNNLATYGFFYNQALAISSVPAGTHLPTMAEFAAAVAGTKSKPFKSVAWDAGSNIYGFNAVAAGQNSAYDGIKQFGSASFMWSADAGQFVAFYSDAITDGIERNSSPTGNGFSVRVIVDSGNVPDAVVTTPSTSLYTAPFPYNIGMVVKTLVQAPGLLDSLPSTIHPFDTETGYRVESGWLSTPELGWLPQVRPAWMTTKMSGQVGMPAMTSWMSNATYQFDGTILGTPVPSIGSAATAQPRLFVDEGIQISVFPRQPHAFNNRVEWGNGPVTDRSLKVFWRIPQTEEYLFGSVKTDVKKALVFGDLDITSQSDTWAIGGAQAQAELTVPDDAHYIDVDASLGFVTGTAQSAPVRVTGGRNSPPMAIWLSPGAGNARVNVPFQCNILVSDPDLDNIDYIVTANGTQITNGTVSTGTTISFSFSPNTIGPLALVITLIDRFEFETVVPAPAITVLNNAYPGAVFVNPASNVTVYAGTKVQITAELTDAESEDIDWTLLRNTSTQLAHGSSSSGSEIGYRLTVPAGESDISIVLADPLGAAPPVTGPVIRGALTNITGISASGTLQSLVPVTLTPTLLGVTARVEYKIVYAGTTTELSSVLAPFSIDWVPEGYPFRADAVVTATAYDAAGYSLFVERTFSLDGALITGVLSATEPEDTASFFGVEIGENEGAMYAVEPADEASVTGSVLPPVLGTIDATDSMDTVSVAGHTTAENTGTLHTQDTSDTIAVTGIVANPISGTVLAVDVMDTFKAYDSDAPVDWLAWCNILELDDTTDIRAVLPLLAEAYSAYDDVVEFVVEIQKVTVPNDPEHDPSPWQVLKYVVPTRG